MNRPSLRAPGAAVVTTAVVLFIPVVASPHAIFVVPVFVVLLGLYALAAVAARLPYERPIARGPWAGVATAILVWSVGMACGSNRLWVHQREYLVLAVLALSLGLYTEEHGRSRRETLRLLGPSVLAVVAFGGVHVGWVLALNAWMWDASSTWSAPWAGVRFLAELVATVILPPLAWSCAVCHVLGRRWPGFAAPGWPSFLVRALPGAVLVLVPIVVLWSCFAGPRQGEPSSVTWLLRHAAYLVAAAGMLLARKWTPSPAVASPVAP